MPSSPNSVTCRIGDEDLARRHVERRDRKRLGTWTMRGLDARGSR
jgi:hypothetical protein